MALAGYARQEALLKRLADRPTDRGLLQQLNKAIADTPNAEQKMRLGAIYALGCLANGMHKEWTTITAQMHRFNPQSPWLALLSLESLGDVCSACGGPGYTIEECARCKGAGCAACQKSGVRRASCATCRERGRRWSEAEANAMYLKFLQGWTLEKVQADTATRVAAQNEEIEKARSVRKHEQEYRALLRGMDGKGVQAQLRILHVIGQGALATGASRQAALPDRFLVDMLPDVVDGEMWQGVIYPLGRAQVKLGNQSVTLRVFTASKEQAAMAELHAKLGKDRPEGPAEKGTSTGTGWFVGSGHIVTCWHVVENRRQIWIVSETLGKIPVKMVLRDERHDLAVLEPVGRALSASPPGIPLARALPDLGERVFTIGFPIIGILGKEPRYTDGSVSSLAGMKDDPRTLQMSVPVQAGNSGGPLINERGEAVGVVASKLHAINIFRWTQDLPQNVNFAVKVQYLETLLALLPRADGPPNVLSFDDVATRVEMARRVQGSIVQILAE